MDEHRGSARQISRADDLEIACQTVAADGGIVVLPCFIGDAVPDLQRVFAERVGMVTGWIVYHETVRDAARVRAVVEALLEFFRHNEAMFSGSAPSGR